MRANNGANVFSTAVAYFDIVSVEDFAHVVGISKMVIDKLQKRFGNICRNCFVERWVEPNNIAFSISGWLLLYWLLVF